MNKEKLTLLLRWFSADAYPLKKNSIYINESQYLNHSHFMDGRATPEALSSN